LPGEISPLLALSSTNTTALISAGAALVGILLGGLIRGQDNGSHRRSARRRRQSAGSLLYVLSGRMKIVMEDGTEGEIGPGDAAHIAPGHDAWTVGDEACVAVDFGGASSYAKRQ
jgi:hypothetical protein